MREIYTIGYSCFEINEFIDILKSYKINALIDVRSTPVSKIYFDYNKEQLSALLKEKGIVYRNYKREFGARQENINYFTDGYLDFEKFTKSDIFISGIKKIENGIKKNYTFVLMCAEKDPAACHRNIMIAREFYKRGYKINNILCDGSIESQESIENRLVKHYFPDSNQITLFDDELTMEEKIEESYKLRGKEIAFRPDDKGGIEYIYG